MMQTLSGQRATAASKKYPRLRRRLWSSPGVAAMRASLPRALGIMRRRRAAQLIGFNEKDQVRSVEHHHGADRLAAPQCRETLVDGGEGDAAGDQLVEQQPAVEISVRQHWEIARRPGVAVARAADALLLHQRAPAEGDVLLDVDLAEPHHLAARPQRLDRGAERRRAARRLDHRVDAAAAGLGLADRDRIVLRYVHATGGAHLLRQREL